MNILNTTELKGFLGGSVVKNLAANTRDASLIPGSGKSPGEGNGNPLQHSCLKNHVDQFMGSQRAKKLSE